MNFTWKTYIFVWKTEVHGIWAYVKPYDDSQVCKSVSTECLDDEHADSSKHHGIGDDGGSLSLFVLSEYVCLYLRKPVVLVEQFLELIQEPV